MRNPKLVIRVTTLQAFFVYQIPHGVISRHDVSFDLLYYLSLSRHLAAAPLSPELDEPSESELFPELPLSLPGP